MTGAELTSIGVCKVGWINAHTHDVGVISTRALLDEVLLMLGHRHDSIAAVDDFAKDFGLTPGTFSMKERDSDECKRPDFTRQTSLIWKPAPVPVENRHNVWLRAHA